MELMKGGELLDKIIKQRFFSEKEAAAVVSVLVSSVSIFPTNKTPPLFADRRPQLPAPAGRSPSRLETLKHFVC